MSTTYFLALLQPIVVGTDLAIEGLARLVPLPVADAVEAAVFWRRPVADSLRSPDAAAAASRTIAPAAEMRRQSFCSFPYLYIGCLVQLIKTYPTDIKTIVK